MGSSDTTRGPLRVLVVDDEPAMLDVVEGMLSEAMPDARVTRASDGKEALERIAEESPDLLVLGVFLGDASMTGFDVLEEIRRGGNDVAVVLMSGNKAAASEAADRWLSRYDRVSFLPKPFTRNELVEAVRLVLSPEGPS
jgi:two-component system OmpR family response regulator